jgi:hypothetical protein
MSYIQLDPFTTYCPDTPENWREFYQLKKQLSENTHRRRGQAAKVKSRGKFPHEVEHEKT